MDTNRATLINMATEWKASELTAKLMGEGFHLYCKAWGHKPEDILKQIAMPKMEPATLVPVRNPKSPFAPGASVMIKIRFVFDSYQRFMSKSEICSIVDELEGTRNFKDKLTSQLSMAKSNVNDNITSVAYKGNPSNTVWGLKTWVDLSTGEILPKHLPNEDKLPYKKIA